MIKYIFIFLDGSMVWSAEPPTMEDYESLDNGDIGIIKIEANGVLKEIVSFDQEIALSEAKIEETSVGDRYHTS